VCFFVTAPLTLVIDVLTLHLNAFISLVMYVFINMCFRLTDLNRLHNPPLLPQYNPPLPSSQICSIPHCFTPLQPLIVTLLPVLNHHFMLPHNSLIPSLPHHHMHIYLTIILQVQDVEQFPLVSNMTPLLMLGQSPVPLQFLLVLLALKLL